MFLVVIGAVTTIVTRKHPEISAPTAWFALIAGGGLPFIPAFGFGYFLFCGHLSNGTLAEGTPQVNVPIHGRSIPPDRVDFASPRIIDMTESREARLTRRTNGLGVSLKYLF